MRSALTRTRATSFAFIARQQRCYHEVSFQSNGEPLDVLDYRQRDDNGLPPSSEHVVGVDMLFAPLNPADVNTIQGRYPASLNDTITRPSQVFDAKVAGSEGIGRIRSIDGASGSSLKEGDIVTVGLPGLGTMRSFLWAPADALISIDRGEELLEQNSGAAASTLPQLGGTALRMLSDFDSHDDSSGLVIQNAGNSGVGFMASQLASVACSDSPNVISIVRRGFKSNDEWQALVEHLTVEGKCFAVVAEEDLATKEGIKDFQASLKSTPTLALNAVGGASASMLAKLLGPSGSMVTYGGMSKEPVTASTPHFIFKDLRYFGYWHSRWMTNTGYNEKKEMIDLLVENVLDRGVCCPPIEEFSLFDFSEAIHFDANQSVIRRKVVFNCQEK